MYCLIIKFRIQLNLSGKQAHFPLNISLTGRHSLMSPDKSVNTNHYFRTKHRIIIADLCPSTCPCWFQFWEDNSYALVGADGVRPLSSILVIAKHQPSPYFLLKILSVTHVSE